MIFFGYRKRYVGKTKIGHSEFEEKISQKEKGKVKNRSVLNKIALALVIIGALNWGLVGIFSFDAVAWIAGGATTWLARLIYIVVALAGLWCVTLLFREEEDMRIDSHA